MYSRVDLFCSGFELKSYTYLPRLQAYRDFYIVAKRFYCRQCGLRVGKFVSLPQARNYGNNVVTGLLYYALKHYCYYF